MRRLTLLAGLFAFTACPPQSLPNPSPMTQFYFPTGLAHVETGFGPDAGAGYLYVASANFDKRFDNGAILAIDLDKVGLPPFNATLPTPKEITDLKVAAPSYVQISSFAGEMVVWRRPGFAPRLFVPSRAEDYRLYVIDAPTPAAGQPPTMECNATTRTRPPATPQPDGGFPLDCTLTGISMTQFEKNETGIPRAPSPVGVALSGGAKPEIWISSMQQADSPRGSTLDPRGFVVHLDAEHPELFFESYVDVGSGATHGVVVGKRFAFVTGRIYQSGVPANLVRAVDTQSHDVFSTGLENSFTAFEGRGVALSTDEKRLYVLGRSPDTLLVANIADPNALVPTVRVERSVAIPESPNLISVIPRPGKSDLLAITCSTAGVVAFYDDEVGNLVGQIGGVGLQPYAIATHLTGTGARLYVSNFADGRVAVIDVPNLDRPASAKIVAFLGGSQLCLTRGANEPSCDGGTQ